MPVRGTVILAGLLFVVVYETQPDFQRWVNYQAVKAGQWLRYGVEWLAWKQRQQERGHGGV